MQIDIIPNDRPFDDEELEAPSHKEVCPHNAKDACPEIYQLTVKKKKNTAARTHTHTEFFWK